MRSRLLSSATWLVRAWTRVYTCGLSPNARAMRRAEIDSDLWELEHDPDALQGREAAAAVLARLLIGVPDDLAWRLEAGAATPHHAPVRALAAAGTMSGPRRVTAFGLAATVHIVAFSAVMWVTSPGAVLSLHPAGAVHGQMAIAHERTKESVMQTPVQKVATSGRARALGLVSAVAVAVAMRMGLINPPRLAAQAPPSAAGPAFEVASIKPTRSTFPIARVGLQRGGRFTAENATTVDLLRAAYGLRENAPVVGAPTWATEDRFDVEARTRGDASMDEARAGLKTLLVDRFALSVHAETRPLPIYALVLASPGGPPKVRASAAECGPPPAPPAFIAGPGRPSLPPPPPPPPAGAPVPMLGRPPSRCPSMFVPGYFAGRAMTMGELAFRLSLLVDRPVSDQTALPGEFDVDLAYRTDAPNPSLSPDAPSVFTAVQEQLGLKLNPTTGPVTVLVIDRVERPTPN